jgi:peptide/nickel transport system substrate-binding protein
VVPDLATRIPDPSNGGRTYVFTLRKGVHWSTGEPVTVLDIERGLRRTLAAGFSGLSQEIAGAGNCSLQQCSASGITVDSATSTITITLRRPSADFLEQLAVAVAAPADTPLTDQGRKPIPATGPYEIVSDNGKLILLRRNKYFEQWSADAQPAGFPDQIVYSVLPNDDPKIAAERIAEGAADWADARGAAPLGTLESRFPNRLYISPTETSHGVMLNTRVAPFNDRRVREALAYAVDRETVVKKWFTPAVPTCQLLPPNFPGYRPYCPYTLSAETPGAWRAPNFPTAQRLVDASHTKGMRVVVQATPLTAPGMRSVVAALNQLGYHAKLSVYEKSDYFEYLDDSRNRYQAAFGGWVADIPNADNFFGPFTCKAFVRASPDNTNIPEFCDPVLDRLRAQAVRAETVSPGSAADLWAAADKRLVDEAPWIGLVTPSWVDAVSPRVHNYERSSVIGVDFGQMWVR